MILGSFLMIPTLTPPHSKRTSKGVICLINSFNHRISSPKHSSLKLKKPILCFSFRALTVLTIFSTGNTLYPFTHRWQKVQVLTHPLDVKRVAIFCPFLWGCCVLGSQV